MLPISLRPNGRRAVIVGGGSVATRKAESLLSAGFPVFVVAERIGDRLRCIVAENAVSCEQRAYETRDVDGAAIVVAATSDSNLNARVVTDARSANVLVCDATHPERGDFTMPATRRIGELTISVDSGGAAPAFSRRVAAELAARLDDSYSGALRTLGRMRTYVMETFPASERAAILRALAERPMAELADEPRAAICATRRSELAMVQSRSVAARLAERAVATILLGVTTAGDRDRQTPIEQLGGSNVFVKELEQTLREGRADFAVHSCKDLAGALPDDMRIVAISPREDPRDAFCSERYESFEALPAGAIVGTSSPRRRAQLALLRSDLGYESLRGNVDTRLRKLHEGQYDAIVVAMAGLKRLDARARYVSPFAADRIVPAAGQGALAIETRAADDRFEAVIRATVNDGASELCITCERAALRALRAGCSAPLGIHAQLDGDTMHVNAFFARDTASPIRARVSACVTTLASARALGTALAEQLTAPDAGAAGAVR
ncbi:MAG TPA: hydroxymethylbilane synthase [Candidatus Cybelea sp.]|nr:hydroxymethylbilane synthase [Candidatus Cybelea sp.]